jgi:lipid-binding SYLF domain-containing protein
MFIQSATSEEPGIMLSIRKSLCALSIVAAACSVGVSTQASAATAAELNAKGQAALQRLYAQSPRAVRYARDAKAILVFPEIVKAGFVIGGQGGEGVLYIHGRPAGYFKIAAVSYGLQAGAQSFSYALFMMNNKALNYLNTNDRWQIGSGPSVVVIDKGAAMSTTSTTLTQDVYAMPFGQKGLMAGIGIEGSKITRINK